MKALVTWLLGIDRVALEAADRLHLHWQTPYPRWLIAFCCLALFAVIVWAYQRQSLSTRRRALLCFTRLAGLTVLLLAIGQPVLVLEREIVEDATVTIMLDASASMAVRDAQPDSVGEGEASRLDRAMSLLMRDDFAAINQLARNNTVAIQSFSGDLRTIVSLPRGKSTPTDLDRNLATVVADGGVTDIVRCVTGRLTDRCVRHAGIVLLSDGRQTAAADIGAAIQAARVAQAPVHCVALGSGAAPLDLSIVRTTAPTQTFADDIAVVVTDLRITGNDKPTTVIARFIGEQDNRQLDVRTVRLEPGESTHRVEAHVQPDRGGSLAIRVELDALEGETNLENNVAHVMLHVIDRPLRVLYVEGYPRYEYRYLKNALLREPSIRLSCMLLSADVDFAQEGIEPIRRFPESREEFDQFDVILWGDVDPLGEWLTEAQRQLLIEQVSERGCGFAVIAGQRNAPSGFDGSLLAPLIPIRLNHSRSTARPAAFTRSFSVQLTPIGERSAIFRFDVDPVRSRQLFDQLPAIFWSAPTAGPKPGAQVLMQRAAYRSTDSPKPLLVTARYGAGKTLIQLTDDTWRWRRHDGELLHDAYWVRLVRSLAPDQMESASRTARFISDKPNYHYGDNASIRLSIHDPDALTQLPDILPVAVTDEDGALLGRLQLERTAARSGDYHASMVVDQIGELNLAVEHWPDSVSEAPMLSIWSALPDAETQDARADHALLKKLAAQTGGMFIQAEDFLTAAAKIPDQSIRIPNDAVHSIWDNKLALFLFAMLLTVEWSVRRFGGLP